MTTKLVVVALIVIVGLFVATLLMSASHHSRGDDRPGAASAFKGLQGSHWLTIGHGATTTCAPGPNPGDLKVVSSCEIVVAKRSLLSSPTRVALEIPGSLEVITETSDAPRQDNSVSGECYGTAIDHNGGTITLNGFGTFTPLQRSCS